MTSSLSEKALLVLSCAGQVFRFVVFSQSPLCAQEYAENRSITSVVPVDNPLTTDEPELLEMSPEQAEETQL